MMVTLRIPQPALSGPSVVALVEDDPLLRDEVALHLRVHGFVVHAVGSASALDDLATREVIDLYVIDLNLPGESGLSLCKRLRKNLPHAGIVILTARVAVHDRVLGYQLGGADVYMGKPVSPDELVAVLMSLMRRLKGRDNSEDWTLSLRDRTLQGPLPEQRLSLTHREKTMLVALIQAKDNTLDSSALCDLFGDDNPEDAISKHALEESVARLRKKFKRVQADAAEPAIKSVWGVGYQLCIPISIA